MHLEDCFLGSETGGEQAFALALRHYFVPRGDRPESGFMPKSSGCHFHSLILVLSRFCAQCTLDLSVKLSEDDWDDDLPAVMDV